MTAGTVERKGKGRQRLRWYLFGPLTGIVAAVAVCYVCAALLEREVLPASTMEPLTIASLFVGTAAAELPVPNEGAGRLLKRASYAGRCRQRWWSWRRWPCPATANCRRLREGGDSTDGRRCLRRRAVPGPG